MIEVGPSVAALPRFVGLCRWPQPHHVASFAALTRSGSRDNKNILLLPSVNTHNTPQYILV